MRFSSKADVDSFLRTADITRGIPHVCNAVTKIVVKENPELFDRINDAIENAATSCTKYPSGIVSIMWSKTGKFSQISYDASRVPKAYAFVCILKQWLPD